jgi:hypothetical protein
VFSACSAISASIVCAAPASAQSTQRFTIESAVDVDEFHGNNVSTDPQIVIDISAGVRLGDHWQAYVRPWFRLPRPANAAAPSPSWETELYQAGIRYERAGSIATRVDAGYIQSPIGLGIFDARPDLNPTIVPHLSYVVPMPAFDLSAPQVQAVALSYPLGALLTLSGAHWDARAALLNSSPTREYAIGNEINPRQTPVVVAGAGVTPIVGLRLGVSTAHGDYATADEVPSGGARSVTMIGAEGEYAFRYTKISAEVLRTGFETPFGIAVAAEWFVEGTQTLAPRWFAAGRYEGTSAPPLRTATAVGVRKTFDVAEATLGYRVNPELTLRGSFCTRRFYGATEWDRQAGVSIVWARRWW